MSFRVAHKEYERMVHVTDLMLSAHSTLRDRNRLVGQLLILAIIVLSILGLLGAFVEGERRLDFVVTARYQIWLGVLSALIFFLAMVDLVVDWRGRARLHADAAGRLGELKLKLRGAQLGDDWATSDSVDLATEFAGTMAAIVEIPDRKFNGLKAKHLRKVEISRRLSNRPGARIWWLRYELLRDGFSRKHADDDDS